MCAVILPDKSNVILQVSLLESYESTPSLYPKSQDETARLGTHHYPTIRSKKRAHGYIYWL